MCGIAGIIDQEIKSENLKSRIIEMLSKTTHRGPDNMGSWVNCSVAFGHNRLKIIDLSDRSNQPFVYDDCVITFNGEVYNYLEIREFLRGKGYSFQTSSDTEVVIAAYKYWGTRCTEQFVGMWALAIWDKNKQELFCSRDRFGIKPFYYISQDNKFYFASEYKSLKVLPVFNNKLNIDQINRGLQLGWSGYKEETYYEQIKSLEPGHNLLFSKGQLKSWRYWDLEFKGSDNGLLSAEEKNERFYNLFEESVMMHSRSDVSVGACLSGGLDSSSIASMFGNLFPERRFKTFTIFYEGKGNVDERPFVYEVVNKYKNIDPHYFSPKENDIIEAFDKCMYFSDIPLSGSSFMSQYFLMGMAAKNGVKVLLDGQGSDEYLLGYLHSFSRLIGESLKNYQLGKALRVLLSHKNYHNLGVAESGMVFLKGIYSTFNSEQDVYEHEFKHLFPFLKKEYKKHVPVNLENKSKEKVDNFLYHMMFNTSLPTLLFYEDRNSMAFSLESRVPFLDHRLVEFLFSLPNSDKINEKSETKYLLRKAMKNILPAPIANRKDKKGFVTPGELTWLRGPLKDLLNFDPAYFDWMNTDSVREIVEAYKKGDNKNAKLVWRLATLNYWLKNMN